MSATPTVRILAVGSTLGSIANLFAKVKSINAKNGPFEILLCTGDFFGPPDEANESEELSDLLSGKLEVPIPTYLMQGQYPLPEKVIKKVSYSNGQLCQNVFFAGKANVLVTAQGLRIGFFGGTYDESTFDQPFPEDSHPLSSPYYNSDVLKSFLESPLLPQTTDSGSTSGPNSSNRFLDILLTHDWPAEITKDCEGLPAPEAERWGAAAIQSIVRLHPRYYFTSGGGPQPVFWERPPLSWTDDGRVTRFVSLGPFGGPAPEAGKKKERWFYAFSINPQTEPTVPLAARLGDRFGLKRDLDTGSTGDYLWGHDAKRQRREGPPPGYVCRLCQSTEHFIKDCPQSANKKGPPAGYVCKICNATDHYIKDCPHKATTESAPPENYICKICNKPGHYVRYCPEKNAHGDTGGKRPPPGYNCRACGSERHYLKDCTSSSARAGESSNRKKEIGPDECWFCLSNPRVTKHLIVSIGAECYLTAPKGQLPSTDPPGASVVPGGGHILIIPISHFPTLQSMPTELSIPIIAEIERYKSALRKMFAKFGAVPIVYEVARLSGAGGHAHVQVVPVPSGRSGDVETYFRQEGEAAGLTWEDEPEAALERASQAKENYFKVDLPDGGKMVHLMKPGKGFNLQFGRAVLAKLLGVDERIDWKACVQSEADEKRDAAAFKTAFAPFDPSTGSS